MRVFLLLLVISSLLSSSLAQTTDSPTTSLPTLAPSNATTEAPTTEAPTEAPTTEAPTTQAPTEAPTTIAPTTLPTLVPPNATAAAPTNAPTTLPTLVPPNATAAAPTAAPGAEPTSPPNSGILPTPANIVYYQEVVASQGSYAQIDASLRAWSQRLYQTLGLTGPIELAVGWARVPDRTGFENGCNGPYPNIADLFVHIQVNTATYDSVKSALESFIAANRMTTQPNIVCSARSVVQYIPGCGKVTGGAPINNGTIAPPSNISSSTGLESNISSSTGLESNISSSTGLESNISSSTGLESNISSSTGLESNISSSTGLESNFSSSTESSIPSNGTGSESSLFSSSIVPNSTNTTLTPTVFPVGGASQDAGASGGISIGEAHTTTMTTGSLGVILLVSMAGTML